jgi:hypothetical protein
VDSQILNSQALHSGDPLGCCVFNHGGPEQILRRFFHRPIEEALKCRRPSLVIERLALLNQRYIAMAEGAEGNWYNLWTDLEDSKALGGSTTDAQSQQGGGLLANRSDCLVFFWVVLRNVATMVLVKLLSMYPTWMYSRNDQILDVEKYQQNHEACSPVSTSSFRTNSSDVQLLDGREKCWC